MELKAIYTEHKKAILCLGIAVIFIIVFASLGGVKYSTDIISNIFEKQTNQITKTLNKNVCTINKIVSYNNERVIDLDKQFLVLEKKEKGVKDEIQNIKEPKDSDEINRRATALGLIITIK